MLKTNQIEGIAHKAKYQAFGDWTSLIKTHPYCDTLEPVPRPFLLSDVHILIESKLENMIGWAHPDLVTLA